MRGESGSVKYLTSRDDRPKRMSWRAAGKLQRVESPEPPMHRRLPSISLFPVFLTTSCMSRGLERAFDRPSASARLSPLGVHAPGKCLLSRNILDGVHGSLDRLGTIIIPPDRIHTSFTGLLAAEAERVDA